MKPLLLTMEAFGSYGKRTSISFEEPDQNLFLITGDTGAGKSTIFDAIVFALYGEASSNANRKDGAELQSQYAQPGMVPFVELTFSEGRGQAQKIYTVRRTPRYKRPLKRGSGMKDVSETVSLRLPDGTEYPPKETDKKLMELVGLTKAQFMQVAMIAQGEFMEFLRAKSDDKKAIFRKLFHTGQFQEITEEFGRRRKEKEEEISQIRTACRAEAARIVLPEEYQGDFLSEFRERVRGDGPFVKEDFEQLLSELEKLCLWLKKELTESEERYLSLSRQRDERRDELTRARQLQDLFAQLKEAEGQLELSLRQEGQINEAAALGERINRAYQILEAFGRFQEEARRAESCRDQLEQQKKRLPALKQGQEAADLKEAEEKEKLNQQLERFSRVSDRVNRAMDLFRKRSEAREETDQRKEQVRRAEVFFERAKKDQEEFEQKERKWRQQSEQLSGAQQEFALWQVKWKGHEEQKKEAAAASLLGEEWEAQRSLLEEAVKRYGAAREHYQKKNSRYELLRQQFLDAQAGFLASQLKPGKPCPVCGSREHPSPCLGEGGEQAVSRQELDGLEAEVARLRASQEELAGKAQAKEALVREKGEQFRRELKKLKAALLETALPGSVLSETAFWGITSPEMKDMEPEKGLEIPEPQTALEVLRQELERRELLLKQEGREAKRREQLCEQVRFNLSKADEEKAARAAQVEQARQTLEEARKKLEQSRARMGTYEKEIEYPDKEAARAEYAGAKARFESAKKAHEEAEGEARKCREFVSQAQTLISRFEEELPAQIRQRDARQEDYRRILEEKQLTEEQWRSLTKNHREEEAQEIDKQVQAYRQRRAALEAGVCSLKEAIGRRTPPLLDQVEAEYSRAKEQFEKEGLLRQQLRSQYETNQAAYKAMEPCLRTRREAAKAYARLDRLYRALSGNVSGSRMDLETYVQRYYLEQILDAANRRFLEMSAGQFELRMYDLKKAGEGKNRGLDLMVYSFVTGKEREIRTLSGGESFMAALSLALGMADRIQAASSAINLDILFIDEGFGSLDEHSRDQAVRVLQEMAGGSRLVGLISHVTELKQEIEDQLIVTRGEEGSMVRWKIS